MKSKAYKTALLVLVSIFAVHTANFAQQVSSTVNSQSGEVSVKTRFDDKEFKARMKEMSRTLKAGLKDLGKNITATINDVAPKIDLELQDLGKNIDITLNQNIKVSVDGDDDEQEAVMKDDDGDDYNDHAATSLRVKNYSKSYPLDANDQIKLSSQYGKITINTWDRHEIKVDIQIKAEAESDEDAQKLLDGVQINDGKNGDQVFFRTQIERNGNGNSWKIWNWSNNKKHKITVNYLVYMPARTDLNVEESYGSIQLPDLDGRVRISSSYGSVMAQNLSNVANNIEGSYGSLKVESMNGGRLDFSYGSAEIEDCTNLKADLSYGSFKLGRLKGAGEFSLSYVGGFKISEVANSFKKLNIDASYSSVALGVPNNNFDFDISTSYGGFNYNDDKVTITSKTPPDGSKHIGTSRNYKGHAGKGGTDAQVNIHTSYGSVNFE